MKRRNYPSSAESPDDEEPHKIGGMVSSAVSGTQRGPFAVIQTRLHRLLQTSSLKNSTQQPTSTSAIACPSASSTMTSPSAVVPQNSPSVGAPVSELHPIHQQLQQLHIGCNGNGNGSVVGGLPLEAASSADAPIGDPAAVLAVSLGSPAATPLYHSTVVPPRLMRRHFVRQSSYKLSAPPLSATGGMMSFDEDFESSLMTMSSTTSTIATTCCASTLLTSPSLSSSSAMCCEMLAGGGPPQQLSPTFEEDEQQFAAAASTAGSKAELTE
jgi:hypothetical protein